VKNGTKGHTDVNGQSATSPAKLGTERKRKQRSKRTDAAAIKKRENMRAACECRKQRYTFSEIAEEMGVSVATAYRVMQAVKEIPQEAAEAVRTMILGRLDYFTSRTFEILVDEYEPSLIDVFLKLDDRRARLLGLYKSTDGAVGQVFDLMAFKERLELDRPILRIEAGTPIPAEPML
jgi:hypothetical protein